MRPILEKDERVRHRLRQGYSRGTGKLGKNMDGKSESFERELFTENVFLKNTT